MKSKNRSHISNINRPRVRHGRKYTKFKNGLSMMMLICIKQHLKLNPWKGKQHWGWVEKSVPFKEKTCALLRIHWGVN